MATNAEIDDFYANLDRQERHMPPLVLALSRFVGWIACGAWIGGLSIGAFLIAPAVQSLMAERSWLARSGFYYLMAISGWMAVAGGACALLMVLAIICEARASSSGRILAYVPAVLVVVPLGLMAFEQNMRLQYIMGAAVSGQAFVSTDQVLMTGQIVSIAVIGALYAWLQTSSGSSWGHSSG